jgi:predicted deacylase
MRSRTIDLPCPAPGTRHSLQALAFGEPGARPKAYLQAGLHGDELPGIMALTLLRPLLEAAEREGKIAGEIVVVPVANPIGLGQAIMGSHTGRYDLGLLTNFNRGWPDLAETVAARIGPELGADADRNVALIRSALGEAAVDLPAHGENGALRQALFALAVDADIVLDLHCDLEAVCHLYVGTPLWPDARDLAALIGAEATLLAEVSGGNPFDEACSSPWWTLARRFPDYPIPLACLAATIEYRGLADVSERQGEADAQALRRFLAGRGLLRDDPGPLPPLPADATPLAAVAMVRAPEAGLLSLEVEAGARVRAGATRATLVDPFAENEEKRRRAIAAPIDGLVYARSLCRLARAGAIVAKIAGTDALPDRNGRLLSD